jgi:hypothetical protein
MQKRLREALDFGGNTHTVDDVIAAVNKGEMQAFYNDDALILTEIAVTPRKKYLNMFVACGEINSIMSLQPKVEAFAIDQGCEYMVSLSRKGFRSVLPQHGWREKYVVFQHDLKGAA